MRIFSRLGDFIKAISSTVAACATVAGTAATAAAKAKNKRMSKLLNIIVPPLTAV